MKSSIWRKSICSADFVATDSVAESISWSIHDPMIERHQVDGEYLCRGATGQPPDEIIKSLNNKEPVGPRH